VPTLNINRSDIPLWSGTNGSLKLDVSGDPTKPPQPGASPILNVTFEVDGDRDVALASHGSVGIGVHAGAKARIVPIFHDDHGSGADLVARFSLADALTPDNLLLAFEVGGDASLTATGAFKHSVLAVNASLEAGRDATYVAIRSFNRTTPLLEMLPDLTRRLELPGSITAPPAPGEVLSFEYGGNLKYSVGATAGYELKGTKSINVSEIALSEHYALSVVGKLTVTGQIAGRFSIDVSAGSSQGFARVVVKRRRSKELQIAGDVNASASLLTEGLPPTGKEFLGALLGVQGKNWLNLADSIVSEAGKVDSIETLKARLDGLAMDYLGAFAGNALDQLTSVSEIAAVQQKVSKVVASYRQLDERGIALFDRFFDPAANRIDELASKLDELNALTSWDRLKGDIDPTLWNVVQQLTDGDPLGWALGLVPGTALQSLPELKKRIASSLSLIRDGAHAEIRDFIQLAKEQFGLDRFFNQLATVSTTGGLKSIADDRLGHFVERLIGKGIDSLNGGDLKKALETVQQVVAKRDAFFKSFDGILQEAAAQKFTLDLHAAYNSSSERDALIDIEIKLREPDGSVNESGLKVMAAASRGDFQEGLASFRPDVVKLREGVLSHRVTRRTALKFNVAGWHRQFNYQAMDRVVLDTERQIRDTGNGLITVFTSVDMQAQNERRKRGSKGEEAVLSNFLLRVLGETKVTDTRFDEKTMRYAIDVITGMSARYSVTFTDAETSPEELDDYLEFARAVGLDRVGATKAALAPFLEFRNGSFGKTTSEYQVRYVPEAIAQLVNVQPTTEQIRHLLRRIVFANYFGLPHLGSVGWFYTSDEVRVLVEEDPNNFENAQSILDNAVVHVASPIPGIHAPLRLDNTRQIRADLVRLFRAERRIVDAFKALASLLGPGTGPISVSELEVRLRGFGDALNAFDDFDNGENSIFAVFDGLIALGMAAEKARGSSLTFTSTKDGAEHTKVFALQAVTTPSLVSPLAVSQT
jgi:hypothetical protein